MSAIGRNQLCPCGSKKNQHCCVVPHGPPSECQGLPGHKQPTALPAGSPSQPDERRDVFDECRRPKGICRSSSPPQALPPELEALRYAVDDDHPEASTSISIPRSNSAITRNTSRLARAPRSTRRHPTPPWLTPPSWIWTRTAPRHSWAPACSRLSPSPSVLAAPPPGYSRVPLTVDYWRPLPPACAPRTSVWSEPVGGPRLGPWTSACRSVARRRGRSAVCPLELDSPRERPLFGQLVGCRR